MRSIYLAVILLSLAGCNRSSPAMAGGKWALVLRDQSSAVRKKAAFTLGNIGPSDPAALPALVDALADRDPGVRAEVILALVKYGPGARTAVPQLTVIEQADVNLQVRDYAAKALEKFKNSK
jgi:HEAT repeat protein